MSLKKGKKNEKTYWRGSEKNIIEAKPFGSEAFFFLFEVETEVWDRELISPKMLIKKGYTVHKEV